MSFSDIIGHDKIIRHIIKAIESGKIAHAHIIVGEEGIGKSLIAKNMALKILGEEQNKQHVDLLEWKIAKNKKSMGVKEIRSLIEEINKKPYEGDKKIVIVYKADKMTVQAQNAFLKTIEEPPKGVYIILLCENLEVILDTIKSRCQIHKLRSLTLNEIKSFMNKKYEYLEEEEKIVLAAFSDGIPGRIEKYIEDSVFKDIRNTTLDMLKCASEQCSDDIFIYESFLLKNKERWSEILNSLLAFIRDIIVWKETSDNSLVINIDKVKEIKELSNVFSFNKLNDIIKVIDKTRDKLDRNLNPSLVFEVMLLKIQEV
jgi:DNA polymerase-3 subunit delta'